MKNQNSDPRKTRTSNVNLQALEVYCEVIRRQSFSRGAGTYGLSQSAASQVIAHLEEEVGFQMIDRRQRPLAPTPEGKTYYLASQEILHRHRTALDDIRRRQQALAGTVRVVSIYSVGLHTLNRYIRRFMSRYRGSTVHLEYLHPNKVYAAVLNDEADLGVVSYPKAQRHLEVLPWLEEEMVLVCPPGHRLDRRKSLRLKDLHGEKFVAFDPDLRIRSRIDNALRKRHVSVEVVSEFDNIETIKQALEISEAVSILPRASIQREVERGTLIEKPLAEGDLIRPVGIIFKRKRALTSTTQKFVSTLIGEDVLEEIEARLSEAR